MLLTRSETLFFLASLLLLLGPFATASPIQVFTDRVDAEIDENAARFTQCCHAHVPRLSPELIDTGVCDYEKLIPMLGDGLPPPFFNSPVMQEPASRTAYFRCLSGGRDVSTCCNNMPFEGTPEYRDGSIKAGKGCRGGV